MNTEKSSSQSADDLEKLYPIIGGHVLFQVLSAAVQLDLFAIISKQKRMTLRQVSDALSINDKPALILLRSCKTLGLLRKTGQYYSNSPVAQKYLIRDTPESIVPIIEWQHFIVYRAMYFFHAAITSNTNAGLQEFKGSEGNLYSRLSHEPELEQIFQNAMRSLSAQANQLLAEAVDFGKFRHIVDIGGGDGTNLIRLVSTYPGLTGTVFDLESVCHIAKRNIAASGLTERINVVQGDCFFDPLPTNADCILLSHFVKIWAEERIQFLLQKCYDALPNKGSVVIFEAMDTDTVPGSLIAAISSPYLFAVASGEGLTYTPTEFAKMMKSVGFTGIKKLELPRAHGAVMGTKGKRKSIAN